jgi:hypothetical protein
MTHEQMVRLCRDVVGGQHRPDDECSDDKRTCPLAVTNSVTYDPPAWVIEAVKIAYARGWADAFLSTADRFDRLGAEAEAELRARETGVVVTVRMDGGAT